MNKKMKMIKEEAAERLIWTGYQQATRKPSGQFAEQQSKMFRVCKRQLRYCWIAAMSVWGRKNG
jgi:hypothetical protein